MLRRVVLCAGDNLLMNPQFLWCTLDGRVDKHDLVKQLQAYAAIQSFGEMAHQPFGIVLEVRMQPKALEMCSNIGKSASSWLASVRVYTNYEISRLELCRS
jgi:hypothetical protein